VPAVDLARVNGTVYVFAEGYLDGDFLPLLDESDLD
jgi:hypothetical protein